MCVFNTAENTTLNSKIDDIFEIFLALFLIITVVAAFGHRKFAISTIYAMYELLIVRFMDVCICKRTASLNWPMEFEIAFTYAFTSTLHYIFFARFRTSQFFVLFLLYMRC